MGRLKLLKFDSLDEMFQYYEENEEYLHTETLIKLEDCWNKYGKLKTVDIFNIYCVGVPEMNYLSIMENEWDLAIGEMKNYFVLSQKYELAARARKLEKLVFSLEDED